MTVSKLHDVLDVRDFGARLDGVTDDTAAIQAAIDVAGTTDSATFFRQGVFGREVHIPRGVAMISNLFLRPTVQMRCSGYQNTRLQSIPGSTGDMITAYSWASIRGGCFIDGANNAVRAMTVDGARCEFESIYAVDCGLGGVQVDSNTAQHSLGNMFDHFRILDCGEETGDGFRLGALSADSIISNMWIGECGRGFHMTSGTGANNITNLHVFASHTEGLFGQSSDNNRFTNAYIESNDLGNIRLQNCNANSLANVDVYRVNARPALTGRPSPTPDTSVYATVLRNCEDVTIEGVHRNNAGSGVAVLLDGSSGCEIRSRFRDDQATPTQTAGVEEAGTSDDNDIFRVGTELGLTSYATLTGANSRII